MSLRYCSRCKDVVDDGHCVKHDGLFGCPQCHQELIYLGRESASLSSLDLLEAYDMLHPYNPVQDYQGVYKTYASYGLPNDVSLLECEDILKHAPGDKDALLFMAKHHWKEGRFDRTQYYCDQLMNYGSLDDDSEIFYLDFLLLQKNYQGVLSYFNDYCEKDRDEFTALHYQATAFLGVKDFEKALTAFYRSYYQCDDPDRKAKIKAVIGEVSAYLESAT